MTRPVESVVAEALERLERTGRLDIDAFLASCPEHAKELRELLPAMLALHQEKAWQKAEAQSQAFALGLFAQLSATPGTAAPEPAPPARQATVGTLFTHDRSEAGLTLEEQARRAGLPAGALEQLSRDQTPLGALDNAAIKQLAGRVAAPFTALLKEVRRLIALDSLGGAQPGAVFTREKETSTTAEQQALLDKVREAAGRKPGEAAGPSDPRRPGEPGEGR